MRRAGPQNAAFTKPHRFVSKLLDEKGIGHENEVVWIAGPGVRYWLDIFIEEWNLAIEVDGPWHNKKRDAKRDAYLQTEGVETLRIPSDECVEAAKERVWNRILEFLEAKAGQP